MKINNKRNTKSKNERLPSNLQTGEDTKPGLCTQLSWQALRTQPCQNYALHNVENESSKPIKGKSEIQNKPTNNSIYTSTAMTGNLPIGRNRKDRNSMP